eukprot:gene6447-4646_t
MGNTAESPAPRLSCVSVAAKQEKITPGLQYFTVFMFLSQTKKGGGKSKKLSKRTAKEKKMETVERYRASGEIHRGEEGNSNFCMFGMSI